MKKKSLSVLLTVVTLFTIPLLPYPISAEGENAVNGSNSSVTESVKVSGAEMKKMLDSVDSINIEHRVFDKASTVDNSIPKEKTVYDVEQANNETEQIVTDFGVFLVTK
ncbi:hypothetical protein ABFT51_07350 [Paenibacillus peoriae]|uniref:hypothetical protein n=1 Tax=Paenibacillus peoriae TaxID=59893 RepID=UPI0032AF638C